MLRLKLNYISKRGLRGFSHNNPVMQSFVGVVVVGLIYHFSKQSTGS